MRPVQFDGCMGWLHEGHAKRGVVLCGPLGHEALWTHKLLRALAERFAQHGFWTLRFDYPSAGDSAGDDLAPERFARSIHSIHRAADTLRAAAEIDELTLVGIRAGAAFALLAATGAGGHAPLPLDGFAALAPVVRGRAYLRELSLVQQRWLDTAPPAVRRDSDAAPGLHILGHRYPADLIAALKAIDLCDIVRNAAVLPKRVLLADTEYGDSTALRTAWQERDVPVDAEVFSEWPMALQEGARSRLPLNALDTLTHWVGGARATLPPPKRQRKRAELTDPKLGFASDGVAERLVRVGPDRLVGTWCEPSDCAAPARADTPLLLIANTAANPRSADGRLAVRLARTLARHGIASLRVDIAGIGDSGAQVPDDQSVLLYSERAIGDIAAAADWLAARGHRPIIGFGVCSGAYASLHAAARSPSFDGVIAINLPRFIWPRGMTLAKALKQQTNSARGYLASVRDWRKWRRLLRNGRDLRPVLSALQRLVVSKLRVPIARAAERLGWQPGRGTPRGLMHELAQRKVRTRLVYGEFDPGVDELSRHFGSPHTAFRDTPQVSVETVRHLDHSVYGAAAAETVVALCIETLTGWPGKAPGSVPGALTTDQERRASRPASA